MAELVHAALATIPSRVEALREVVARLLPQVDRLHVYLNGHDDVPDFLEDARIEVARSQEHGDRSDAGKLFWTNAVEGLYLGCDDDILYPSDYVDQIVAGIERHGRGAVVGMHGAVLPRPIATYFTSRRVVSILGCIETDQPVDVIGTGAMGFHTSAIRIRQEHFEAPGMADIWFSVQARLQAVPLVVLAHKPIGVIRTRDTLHRRYRRDDGIHTEALRRLGF